MCTSDLDELIGLGRPDAAHLQPDRSSGQSSSNGLN
jgi:hypothetical protein